MEKKIVKYLLSYVRTNYKTITIGVCISFLFVFLFASPSYAQSAVLSFYPSSGTHPVGSSFSVGVYVSSTDEAINAVSGTVSFPQSNIEVESISESGSIINMWVQQPVFSNSDGTVDFQGIIPNPGFTGASGKIITINFEVKSAGTALVIFSSGSVLANDGIGTDILKNLGSAQFNLSAAAPIKPAAPPASQKVPPQSNITLPPAPQISSPTNPDPNKWYNNSTPKFVWQLPADIISIRALYNKYPSSQPTVVYTPPISGIDATINLKDGVYYFHLQFENSAGWGPVSHFRFQIDTQPPNPFTINLVDGKETDNPQPTISFATTDALSGIDYYKIKINSGDFFAIPPEQLINNSYVLPLQTTGSKSVLVMALDKAGNYEVAYVEFVIKSINPPVITDYPQELENNTALTIKGNSYPDSQIIIWHQGENEGATSWVTMSDSEGQFAFTANEKLKNGVNKIWAQVIDKRGAKSDNSNEVIVIEHESIFFEIGSWIMGNIIVAFLCAFLICLLLTFLAIHSYTRKASLLKVPHRQKHP